MHSRGARLARGWVVGVVATAVAALSHALADGGTPSWLALAAGVVFAGLLGTIATGRRPSLPRLTIAVAGSQLAFHAAFSYLGTSASAAVTMTAHQHGPAMAPMAPLTGLTTDAAVAHHAVSPAMWVGHALAAVATIVFLRHAERALWSLLTRAVLAIAVRLRATAARPAPLAPRRAIRTLPLPRLLSSRLLSSVVSRRGPPLSVVA